MDCSESFKQIDAILINQSREIVQNITVPYDPDLADMGWIYPEFTVRKNGKLGRRLLWKESSDIPKALSRALQYNHSDGELSGSIRSGYKPLKSNKPIPQYPKSTHCALCQQTHEAYTNRKEQLTGVKCGVVDRLERATRLSMGMPESIIIKDCSYDTDYAYTYYPIGTSSSGPK